ncbi:hypothetical protein CONPUDRAFT_53299 [Coniophora puteana RWD-64-598 SS2]|uniref:BTB domain-containing protein n=1 Tax=Coniophora puteana (strain RWD-64-598) TaxID=741705 RepID=A0A5M3MTQ6_CONPW|nr:uncharacterized protein CONPUDRAFT_53299 [Coniophora puteana RWD-64-598 SS2]EIW82549.1 hypothetical protein CONPUDRAFT_53299 [Coniophora puteana RWD-64-598 SS2]
MHPEFSSPDADVILAAKDQTALFRVHSYTLKTTSGWFRSLFSLPQRPLSPSTSTSSALTLVPSMSTSTTHPDTIALDEDAPTLEALLRMVCGQPITPPQTHDALDALLFAAEKYDMPGPLALLRILLAVPPLSAEPLRIYAAASRFGWDAEARAASAQTLAMDVHDAAHGPVLRKLSTDAVLALFALHRDRREGLRRRLDEPPFVGAGMQTCPRCRRPIDHCAWRELKYRVILEMDIRPLGDTVNAGLLEWTEAKACWEAKCPGTECACVLYDKGETLRLMRECIESLPKTVS